MRKRLVLLMLGVAVLGVAAWWLLRPYGLFHRTTPVFVGSSTALRQTVIVPTLDSPAPASRNIIWCASFTQAWRQAQTRVFHGPIQLDGAIDVAQRLNNAPISDINLDPKDAYANAGRFQDGIVTTIRRDMAKKFPGVPEDWLPAQQTGTGIVAYGYLATHVKFDIPYPQIPGGDTFTDGAQHQTPIRAFGITSKYQSTLYDLRKQVDVIFYNWNPGGTNEYAIDLCRTSQPYQLVLARVPRRTTLAETIAEMQRRSSAASKSPQDSGGMGASDTLIVPEMCWRITHHFAELEGKSIRNPDGAPLIEAKQIIDFTLDRSGVKLSSMALKLMGCRPKMLSFTHPFLLYLTRRGSDAPFFAMWVENAELLDKQ